MPVPLFRTVAERVSIEPAIGLVLLTENLVTTRAESPDSGPLPTVVGGGGGVGSVVC